jgi:hypothetical protein
MGAGVKHLTALVFFLRSFRGLSFKERSYVFFPTHLLSTYLRKTTDVVPATATAAEGWVHAAHLEIPFADLSASEDCSSAAPASASASQVLLPVEAVVNGGCQAFCC